MLEDRLSKEDTGFTKKEILNQYLDYVERKLIEGHDLGRMMKHLFGLSRGDQYAKSFRIKILEIIKENSLKNHKKELEDLKNNQRPKIVEAIAEARSHGDLKENAEYHAAKEQQALIESRVITINNSIARANVIDVTKIENNGKVIFGSTVKLQDLETEKKISYKLVGQDEADIEKNLIFFKSPIGKALISKNKGEMVSVNTPSGEKSFEILEVEYI